MSAVTAQVIRLDEWTCSHCGKAQIRKPGRTDHHPLFGPCRICSACGKINFLPDEETERSAWP